MSGDREDRRSGRLRSRRALRASAAALVVCGALAAAAIAASTDFAERASSPEAVGTIPISVAAADLDGDTDQDLAVANAGSDDVSVLGNNGAGNFAELPTSPETGGVTPNSVVAADLDGDGDSDLAVAGGLSEVTILRNDGSGDLAERSSSPETAGDLPWSVAAADFDGDTDQDLAVANNASSDVTILRNTGSGNFPHFGSSPEAAGEIPAAIAAADLDGDSDQDLAVVNSSPGDVTILRNNGSGNFTERASSPEDAGDTPLSIATADLDGDLDRDLAIGNSGSGDVTIHLNNGSGNFTERASSPEAAGDNPNSVVAADFEDDGDQDLAVANGGSGDLTVLENNGSGNFTEPATSPETAGGNPTSVAALDFDADLDPDLAVANAVDANLTILRNR